MDTPHLSRKVARLIEPQAVVEGAGVRLKRSIATRTLDYLDPFLLFDHFGSNNPDDYLPGFPMHPHRGIETVTYMLAGSVRHSDSLGNSGTIGAGDVQWMTAGGGILHEEMPQAGDGGVMGGFQLWVNLPARLKMTKPRYQEVKAGQIPQVRRPDGVSIRIIAGSVDGVNGAVSEIAADPTYIDITVPAGQSFTHPVPRGHTVFAYLFEGSAVFAGDTEAAALKLVSFADGDAIEVQAGPQGARFLLVSGLPLGEPISRYGPFVMNTRAEIMQALDDLRNGTFVK